MNQREAEVLNIICAANQPLTSSDITDAKKGLTQSTVIAVLRKLASAEAVEVAGVTHSGKVLSRTYVPGKNAKNVVTEHYIELIKQTKDVLTQTELIKIVEEVYKN